MRNKGLFQAMLIAGPTLIMANLSAIIELVLNPDVPYFDKEHLIVGGITGFITAVLFGFIIWYVRRLEKITKDLSDTNAMCTLEIMEHQKTTEALRQQERLLSESQRLGHVGSFFMDAAGLMQWSEELYYIFGVSPDTFTPNTESLLSLIYPEDRSAMQAWINACMAGKRPAALEFRIVFPDGTIRFIRGDGEAVFDDENRFLYLAGLGQDITERNLAEQALRESEYFFDTLLNVIPVPVFYKDREGRYLGFNKAYEAFFGATREHLIGKSVFDISPPKLAKIYHAKDTELFETGEIQQYEAKVKNRQGLLRKVIFNKAIFTDSQGVVTGLIGAILDITARKHAEEELQRYSADLEKKNKELQEALTNVKQLSGMLPICASCKKIRDDKGYWSEVESYISDHTETVFSHGICPDCEKKAYEDIEDLTNETADSFDSD